jgi:hypothetical protein
MANTINNVPLPYEPKKKNRWLLIFPESFELSQWVCSRASRPCARVINGVIKFDPLIIGMYDPIAPSTSQSLYNLITSGKVHEKFDMKIQLLDPIGIVIEQWSLSDCVFTKIDFGCLSYKDDETMECELTIELDKIVLEF